MKKDGKNVNRLAAYGLAADGCSNALHCTVYLFTNCTQCCEPISHTGDKNHWPRHATAPYFNALHFFSFHFFQPLHFDHYRSVNHHFMIFIPILMCGICLIGLSSLRWTCGNSTVFEEVKYFKNIFHNIVILFSFGFDQRVESWVG